MSESEVRQKTPHWKFQFRLVEQQIEVWLYFFTFYFLKLKL